MTDLGYPKDGTDCCSHPPEPGQEVWERCPECLHFYTRIDGVLNCTSPDCPTNALDYVCHKCGETFDVYDRDTLKDVEPNESTICPFCGSTDFGNNEK